MITVVRVCGHRITVFASTVAIQTIVAALGLHRAIQMQGGTGETIVGGCNGVEVAAVAVCCIGRMAAGRRVTVAEGTVVTRGAIEERRVPIRDIEGSRPAIFDLTAVVAVTGGARITSYNVCYTKLLRISPAPSAIRPRLIASMPP